MQGGGGGGVQAASTEVMPEVRVVERDPTLNFVEGTCLHLVEF